MVYDVFAGVGPFAIPLAKKRQCTVYANDLNPASHSALEKNIKLNNIKEGQVIASNLDGKEFILTVIKEGLKERLQHYLVIRSSEVKDGSGSVTYGTKADTDSETGYSLQKNPLSGTGLNQCFCPAHIIMNLPAMAVEFLSSFRGILHMPAFPSLTTEDLDETLSSALPQVFCYAFSPKGEIDTDLRQRVEEALGCLVPDDYSTRLVRNVAPNKEMICISFKLWPELIFSSEIRSSAKVISNTDNADHGMFFFLNLISAF